MADEKVSLSPAAGPLTGAEIIPAVQDGDNVQTTAQDIADLAPGGGSPVMFPLFVEDNPHTIVTADGQQGLIVDPATDIVLALPDQSVSNTLPDGFYMTLAVRGADGSVTIDASLAAELMDLTDGSTGDKVIAGFGWATLWYIGSNTWNIYGSNVAPA